MAKIATPCTVFAGGKSSRMGEDKALLPFGGYSTLAEFQYRRLSSIFEEVYVSVKDRSIFNFEAEFIEDIGSSSIFAPTIGFTTLFATLKNEKFFVISVDAPSISKSEIIKLSKEDSADFDATIAVSSSGIHPMIGIYHRSLEEKFIAMQRDGMHRLGKLLSDSKTKYVEFKNEDNFINLNHMHEYKKAMRNML